MSIFNRKYNRLREKYGHYELRLTIFIFFYELLALLNEYDIFSVKLILMASNQTIVVPSRIGPFVFRGTVGAGAFSVVKLAFHARSKIYFACKVVPRNRLNNDDLEQRFEMEIRINQQMHHSGVVQIVDLLKDDMNYYIFMEFCPNGELFKYIVDRTKLTEDEAAVFMFEFLDAIHYVHSLGVAHRDLKPENLLLDSSGKLKVSDFGLSKFVGNSGIVETPCGSPCYASPECLSGHSYDGRMSDVWSIGVIMFAMVTGQLPWTKRNQAQLFNQIRKGDYKIPSFLSDECKDLLSRLLTVDVSQRIKISDALNHPWFKSHNISSYKEASEKLNSVSNISTKFEIVSLKKVDLFFDKSDFTDASIDEILKVNTNNKENNPQEKEDDKIIQKKFIERELSQKIFSFKSASNAIKDKDDPILTNNQKPRGNSNPCFNNERARYGVSQSLKIEKKRSQFMDSPNIKMRKLPSSSFGEVSSNFPVKRNISFGLVPAISKGASQGQINQIPNQSLTKSPQSRRTIVPPHVVVPKTQLSWPNKVK